MKLLLGILLIAISYQLSAQDTNNFYINSFHLEYTFSGRVNRSATLPDRVRKRSFYQTYFGENGVPERVIDNNYYSKQFGVNLGFRFDSYSQKNNHELLIGIGFQNSGEYKDVLTRNNIPSQDSSGMRSDLARIEIEQEYREVYFNGAWLFKTKGRVFSVHTGIGFNLAFSSPQYWVTEFEKEVELTTYQVRNGITIYRTLYIPFGFEVKGDNGNGGGFVLGMDYSIRIDNHVLSGFSLSLGYKLFVYP